MEAENQISTIFRCYNKKRHILFPPQDVNNNKSLIPEGDVSYMDHTTSFSSVKDQIFTDDIYHEILLEFGFRPDSSHKISL